MKPSGSIRTACRPTSCAARFTATPAGAIRRSPTSARRWSSILLTRASRRAWRISGRRSDASQVDPPAGAIGTACGRLRSLARYWLQLFSPRSRCRRKALSAAARTSGWAAAGPDRAASPIVSNTSTRPRLTSSAACASSALLYRASTPIVAASFRRGILPPRTRRAAARTRRLAPTGMASSRDSMGRRRAAPSPPAAQPPMPRRLVYLMPWPTTGGG